MTSLNMLFSGTWTPLLIVILLALIVTWVLIRVRRNRQKKQADSKNTSPTQTRIGRLDRYFQLGFRLLRKHLSGRGFPYQLPWFVMLGEQESGKTSLLHGAGLEQPLDQEAQDRGIHDGPCGWFYYERAIVLDPSGSMIVGKDGHKPDEAEWRAFAKRLNRARPKRPLDGVILTLPVEDLMADDPDAELRLASKLEVLDRRINLLQAETGISVPVFVIVTKTDQVEGFREFCAELPSAMGNHMFGWSIPHDLRQAYNRSWVDQCFEAITERLEALQLEVAYDGFPSDAAEGFFLFPRLLVRIKPRLHLAMQSLFNQTSYRAPVFLRGIYFSGRAHLRGAMGAAAMPAATTETTTSESEVSSSSALAETAIQGQLVFIRDLLQRKVFTEYHLALPTARKKLLQQRRNWLWRLVFVALTAVILFGMLRAHQRLSNDQVQWEQSLQGIQEGLDTKYAGNLSHTWFHQGENPLFQATHLLETKSFSSPFFPGSWLDRLDHGLYRSVTIGYEHFILDYIGEELARRAKILSTSESNNQSRRTIQSEQALPFSDRSSFKHLVRYVDELNELNHHVDLYNGMTREMSIDSVRQLIRFCFDFEVHESTLKRFRAYKEAFQGFESIQFTYRQQANHKAKQLYQHLLADMFYPAITLDAHQQSLLRDLTAQPPTNRDASIRFFRELTNELAQVKHLMRLDQFGLLNGQPYELDGPFEALLSKVDRTTYLDPKLGRDMHDQLKTQLINYKTTLDPPFLNQAVAAIDAVRAVLSLPFMSHQAALDQMIMPRQDFREWKEADLDLGIAYDQRYQQYQIDYLKPLGPSPWTHLLEHQASHYLIAVLDRQISQEPIIYHETDGHLEEERLAQRTLYFLAAHEALETIGDIYTRLDSPQALHNLHELVTREADNLLTFTDRLLASEKPYRLDIRGWDGRSPLLAHALGLRDEREIEAYVEGQRELVRRWAFQYARPVIAILETDHLNRNREQQRLLVRWQDILNDLEAYAEQRPYPAIRQLEHFFLHDLSRLNLANYQELVADYQTTSGYFQTLIAGLKKDLYLHCKSLERPEVNLSIQAAHEGFQRDILGLWRDRIVGNFPFADAKTLTSVPPQELAVLREKVQQFSPILRLAWREKSLAGTVDADHQRFLDQLEASLHYLEPILFFPEEPYQLRLQFRASRKQERHANQVMQWQWIADGLTRQGSEPQTFTYSETGQDIVIRFRWAKDAPLMPASDPDNPWLTVEGREARFTFPGPFALSRLLASQAELDTLSRKVERLRFTIPLTQVEQDDQTRRTLLPAVIYFDLDMRRVGAAEAAPFPDFSFSAPRADSLDVPQNQP